MFKHKLDNSFLLFDLDGTLLDTDPIHLACYELAGAPKENLAHHLRRGTLIVSSDIKYRKAELVKQWAEQKGVTWMPGAEEFLEYCFDSNVNFCIVTNTPRHVVNTFCLAQPLLHKINEAGRILCREDYNKAKPAPDGYALAVERFRKTEQHCIGFENTYIGCCALEHVTDEIYAVQPGEDTGDIVAKGIEVISSFNIPL